MYLDRLYTPNCPPLKWEGGGGLRVAESIVFRATFLHGNGSPLLEKEADMYVECVNTGKKN